jgi:hypothetical protein
VGFGGLLFIISDCTHYYYVPNVQNVPLFKEKNEVRLTLAAGEGEFQWGEIQAAYSVGKNIGIMANCHSATGNESIVNFERCSGSYFEGGAGYFKPQNKLTVFGEISLIIPFYNQKIKVKLKAPHYRNNRGIFSIPNRQKLQPVY